MPIQIVNRTSSSVIIDFAPPAGAVTSTLYITRVGVGAAVTQAIVSGRNTVSNLLPGQQYSFAALSVDGSSVFVALTAALLETLPDTSTGDDFKIQWKTDRNASFIENGYSITRTRIRIDPNITAHSFAWRIEGDNQNDRLIFRSVATEARIHGQSYEAQQT